MNYPVDVKTQRFALRRKSTGELLKRGQVWGDPEGGEIPGLDEDLQFLLEVREEPPTYNPLTQRIESTLEVDIEREEVVSGWAVIDLEPEQVQANIRRATRDGLDAKWHDPEEVPEYISGPYHPLFIAANDMLDRNRESAAQAMIQSAEPTAEILADTDKLDEFNRIKKEFADAIRDLPKEPEILNSAPV